MIGRTLSHYRITAAIGAGGMGAVYRATDTKLERDVALKVLPAELPSDPDRLARFRREARAVAALNHPHIVTIDSVEEADGLHFLTMELVEGQPLDRLVPAGELPLARVLEIGAALAAALASAHEKALEQLAPVDVAALDAHHGFHLAESFAACGETARALDLLERSVEGFYPSPFIAESCRLLEPLRGTPRFARVLERARELAAAFEPREAELERTR
ncbi:MAG TPA: protein kinase [Candidatus Polarisedimenticolaceae bacterium]|nr:protein kinase [Candidatus Polarisedimenticolaceae bacterium]